MSIQKIVRFLIPVCGILSVVGCTAISPIPPHNKVTAGQLDKDWSDYQDQELTAVNKLKSQIAAAQELVKLRTQQIEDKKNTISQFLDTMNSLGGSGATGSTVLTGVIGALGVGLHLNNLRQDRKIALPEVDPSTAKNLPNATKPPPAPAPGADTQLSTSTDSSNHAAAALEETQQAANTMT